ncbi:hypothetical protein N7510_008700 [Penicillium lagena]|uniref:uncharacterized protein n=1 Tax=Penicillium lagena TaxID=94218 RepID=UPI002540004E|nr:uncharacterized protein N7510_008700 [Penicillium lagena]KAJ5605919.1 hypothetical protein N7510_008700 [Penicillium lagena]
MPRPAPKRTRPLTKGPPPASNADSSEQATRDNASTNAPNSPERGSTLDPRRQLRSQTPMSKTYENAIESSPMGERMGTGSRPGTASRPPTRSRGYSSTLSFAGRKGDMSSRVPGTPAFESSVLSNFRRRPRQQSILHMVQAEDGSSDLDDSDFLGGLSPQDESTPLNLARKSMVHKPAESPSQSPPSSGGSRKRKRATRGVQAPEPEPEPESPSAATDTLTATPVQRDQGDDQPSHALEDTPRALQFPEVLSQTLAPPASSSPPWSPSAHSQTSTAPVVTGEIANTKSKSKNPVYLSTAALQDRLLPRRRQRRSKHRAADEFEVPSDSDKEHDAASGDEDELSYPFSRRPRKPLASTQDKLSTLNRPKTRKTKANKVARSAATYSRSIDKENEQLALSSPGSSPLSSPPDSDAEEETEIRATPRFTSAELRAAAKKFAEIDQWKLEFEYVSASEMGD